MLAILLMLPAVAQNGMARVIPVARRRRARRKTAAQSVSKAQKELAQQMLIDAYRLGRGLETTQRVALMTRLLYTMRPEVMPVEKRNWAEELFGLAQQLPQGDSAADARRNEAIATAAARLSVYDPDRAMDLLDTLPSQGGQQPDARTMAARLVFIHYMQRHGASGAQALLAHGRQWGERGGFPYAASVVPLARLGDAAEPFFRQVMEIFSLGQEGVYGIREFAGLLERAVAMESISAQTANDAGRSVVAQLQKLAANNPDSGDPQPLTEAQKGQVALALADLRRAAPQAYEQAHRDVPVLFDMKPIPVSIQVETPPVDPDLQASFHELGQAITQHRRPEDLRTLIVRDLHQVNDRYKAGKCADCLMPDAQSWALVSLAAHAAPMTIGTQLSTIEDPFWRAYFTAIAAQQVGEPSRVADPTARKIPEKEEAEPE